MNNKERQTYAAKLKKAFDIEFNYNKKAYEAEKKQEPISILTIQSYQITIFNN